MATADPANHGDRSVRVVGAKTALTALWRDAAIVRLPSQRGSFVASPTLTRTQVLDA
jgi:hypothetical protein